MKRRDVQHLELPKTQQEIEEFDFPHLEYGAGFPPYTRGGLTTMYISKLWSIQQHGSFSSPERSNLLYKKSVSNGQSNLSLFFDLATQLGYDSDNERVSEEVGKTGVAIDSVEDMKILFEGIPLDKINVFMSTNETVLPILAFYIVAAEELGFNQNKLKGTLQNDPLTAFMIREGSDYTPALSMRIVGDIFEYTRKHMPNFNPISISGYHMREAGATIEQELAYTLACGLEYLKLGLSRGIDIDSITPRLLFYWGIGRNHFEEIAKMRAARTLWATLVKRFKPKKDQSLLLRAHCQTSGWTLTEQFPYNNITRTAVEALSAVFGGTDSLHTNSFDEAIALPTQYSAKLARNTQLHLQHETQITKTVDPWAGSHVVEKLTHNLITKGSLLIDEIETKGGVIKAIQEGFLTGQIETQKETVIGLNKYTSSHNRDLKIKTVDTEKVRQKQIDKLTTLKINRDSGAVKEALEQITAVAKNKEHNLLQVVIDAARKRATLEEISAAIKVVLSRN